MSHKDKLNLGLNLFMLLLFSTFNFILAKYETAVILSGFFICLFLHFKILTNGVSLAGGGDTIRKKDISLFQSSVGVDQFLPSVRARGHTAAFVGRSLSLSLSPSWSNRFPTGRTGPERAELTFRHLKTDRQAAWRTQILDRSGDEQGWRLWAAGSCASSTPSSSSISSFGWVEIQIDWWVTSWPLL